VPARAHQLTRVRTRARRVRIGVAHQVKKILGHRVGLPSALETPGVRNIFRDDARLVWSTPEP
jgi:hypothetical protein